MPMNRCTVATALILSGGLLLHSGFVNFNCAWAGPSPVGTQPPVQDPLKDVNYVGQPSRSIPSDSVPSDSVPSDSIPADLAGGQVKVKWQPFPNVLRSKSADPYTRAISSDAIQLAQILGIVDKLKQIQKIRARQKEASGLPLSPGERADAADLRLAILEILEGARLEVDFVNSEIEQEAAAGEEVLQSYITARDNRVNSANLWAFRTNGVLWAVAEALDIPTYATPRLSVPSGTIGILAGLVPTAFSVFAVRSLNGTEHARNAYPNMLSKFYELPVEPRIEYPQAVWAYLNAPPPDDTRSRRRILMDHWLRDPNIHVFDHGVGSASISLITGQHQPKTDIQLLTDRFIMIREVKAIVLQMTRPLLELSMVLHGTKDFEPQITSSSSSPQSTAPAQSLSWPEVRPLSESGPSTESTPLR